MSRLSQFFLIALFALIAITNAAQANNDIAVLRDRDAIRGHDAVAKRKRAPKPRVCTRANTTTTSEGDSSKPVQKSSPFGKNKLCLAWRNTIPGSLHFWDKPNVAGIYTWSPWCPPDAKELGIPCFPMFWGNKSLKQWKQFVKKGYSTWALGMNEVNQDGQSKMSPSAGAKMWKTYLSPLKHEGYNLVSPSTSSSKTGIAWILEWFDICPQCKSETSAVAVHFYGLDPEAFIAYITKFHNAVNKPLWVTEVGCHSFHGGPPCTDSQAKHFMDVITEFMDRTSWVQIYCWYGMFDRKHAVTAPANSLQNADGSPSTLGRNYLAAN